MPPSPAATVTSPAEDATPGPDRPDAAAPTILSGYREPSAIFLLGTKTVLADGAAAAHAAERQPGGAIVVEARQLKAFEAAAADARLNLRRLAVIDSFNYSKGKSISLVVYENR